MKNFKSKIIFSVVAILCLFRVSDIYSQVSVILQQPPPFQFETEDLWKVTLNNPGPEIDVYLFGTVEREGQKQVDATTSVFRLPTGTKKVNAIEISPIDIEKYSNEVENTLNATGTFQSGVYSICVYVRDASTNAVLGSFCNDYQIINATQSDLISPNDGDEVLDILPAFNWLPPTPIPSGRRLTYEFRLTEILDRQSAYFAMQSNPLLYKEKNLTLTQKQYPLAARRLEPGKRYAWQVATYIDGNAFSESEVWEFKYMPSNMNIAEQEREKEYNEYERHGKDFEKYLHNQLMSSGRDKKGVNLKPFEFKGSYELDGSHNSRQGNGSEVPTNLGVFKFDPSVHIYGVPFNMNVYLDTRQREEKQNINTFSFEFRPDVLTGIIREQVESNEHVSGFMKFISYFKTLGIGETYPDYTPNTLKGTRMRGVDFEFNPGIFYVALTGLRNLDPVPDKTFTRNIYAGRLGVGSKDESHFHFTVLKGSDDENSIDNTNLPPGLAPKENIVFGTDGRLDLFKDILSLEAEVVGTMLTRDKTAPDLVSEDFPSFLQNLLSPKISSQFDFMYRIGTKFNHTETGTSVEAGFKYYGPGFTSLGAPNIRNGIAGLKLNIKQSFDQKRIKAGIDVQRDENNIGGLNRFTEATLKLGFSLSFNYKDAPFVSITYRPNTVSNDANIDSLRINNTANVFTFLTGINAISKKYINSINLFVSHQGVTSNRGDNDYNLLSFSLNDNLSFTKIPVSIAGSLGFTFTNAAANSTLFNGDLSGTYIIDELWSNTFGLSYFNEKDNNRRIGFYYLLSVPFMDVIDFTFDAQYNVFREEVFLYGNYDEFLFRMGFSKSW